MASPDQLADTDSVQQPSPSSTTAPNAGVNKRYRPAPAKTFQCRGYGDCRMVFSRSEHLARHIRKHTGERPFSCHCGKQFSRLDNLRQHAQTVHADKQDLNERMMRDLSSLHASMAAANKPTGSSRGASRRGQPSVQQSQSTTGSPNQEEPSMQLVKQEDQFNPVLTSARRPRPGTSTGYEGDLYPGTNPSWHVHSANTNSPSPTSAQEPHGINHSFRDSSQSFRAPQQSDSAPSSTHNNGYPRHVDQQHQSFLPFTTTFNFSVTDPRAYQQQQQQQQQSHNHPSTSPSAGGPGSRPPTREQSSAAALPPSDLASRSLPPLSAVVASASPIAQSPQHPFPNPAFFRRPATASARPGTAPASFFHQSNGNVGRDLSNGLSALGGLGGPNGYHYVQHYQQYYPQEPTSPIGLGGPGSASNDSPFSFHPPPSSQSPPTATATSSHQQQPNPRKRPFPDDEHDKPSSEQQQQPQQRPGTAGYDYESESRPQSRRLSVMELCNEGAPGSRPGTASNPPLSAPGGFSIGKEPSFAFDVGGNPNGGSDPPRSVLSVRGGSSSSIYAQQSSSTATVVEESERRPGSQQARRSFFWSRGNGAGDWAQEECNGDDGGNEPSPFAFGPGYGSESATGHVSSSSEASRRLPSPQSGDSAASSAVRQPLLSPAPSSAAGATRSVGFNRSPAALAGGRPAGPSGGFSSGDGGVYDRYAGSGVGSGPVRYDDTLSGPISSRAAGGSDGVSSASSSPTTARFSPSNATISPTSPAFSPSGQQQRVLSSTTAPLSPASSCSSSPSTPSFAAAAPRSRLSSTPSSSHAASYAASSPSGAAAAASYGVRGNAIRDGMGGGSHHALRRSIVGDGDAWAAGGRPDSSSSRRSGNGGGVQVAGMRV